MSKKYNLKISSEMIKVFDVYRKIDPLKRHSTISQFLNSIINEKANEILDILRSKIENNPEIEKILEEEKYKEVKRQLELDLRF